MMKSIHMNICGQSKKVLLPIALMSVTLVSYAGSTLPANNAVVVTKNLNSKKHKIRLFTASDYKTLLFTVDGETGTHYTLYVFDFDGKLVMQSAILNQETSILPEIHAGEYLYEVLAGDNKIESGQIKIK
jgi:hypothetical protein